MFILVQGVGDSSLPVAWCASNNQNLLYACKSRTAKHFISGQCGGLRAEHDATGITQVWSGVLYSRAPFHDWLVSVQLRLLVNLDRNAP